MMLCNYFSEWKYSVKDGDGGIIKLERQGNLKYHEVHEISRLIKIRKL